MAQHEPNHIHEPKAIEYLKLFVLDGFIWLEKDILEVSCDGKRINH